jgi:hypothetical protein
VLEEVPGWPWDIAGGGGGSLLSHENKNAPESPGRSIAWLGRSGCAGLHGVYPPDRLAIALTKQAELSLLF